MRGAVTPAEAVVRAAELDAQDDEEHIERVARMVVVRVECRPSRVRYRAAVVLCNAKGHIPEPPMFGPCSGCRDAIADVLIAGNRHYAKLEES